MFDSRGWTNADEISTIAHGEDTMATGGLIYYQSILPNPIDQDSAIYFSRCAVIDGCSKSLPRSPMYNRTSALAVRALVGDRIVRFPLGRILITNAALRTLE